MRIQEPEGRRVREQMNLSRFSLYAPLLPGRRYSFDVDFEAPGQEGDMVNYDAAEDKLFGHDIYDRSSLCPPPPLAAFAPLPPPLAAFGPPSPTQHPRSTKCSPIQYPQKKTRAFAEKYYSP
jgi:hypothetical protein